MCIFNLLTHKIKLYLLFILIITVLLTFSACGTYRNQVMIHPDTQDRVRCEYRVPWYVGFGVIGLVAWAIYDAKQTECIERYRGLGYVEGVK